MASINVRNVVSPVLAAVALLALATAVLYGPPSAAQQTPAVQPVESVAAIVGKEVILKSELDEQVMVYCIQAQIAPTDSVQVEKVTKDILESMINAKLIVNEARERKIVVSNEELNAAVDDALNEVKNRMGTEERFAEELARENLTVEDLKTRYRKELENQLLAKKLVDRQVSSRIKVTDKEVDDFYKERKEELPKRPPEITLAQIVILPEVDSLVDASTRARAEDILKAIKSGESFEDLARNHSDDDSAERGGDVGTFRKGEFEESFEKAAFALEPGQVSEPVRSRFGYHLIKLVEKQEDAAHVKHILLKTIPTDEAEENARALATQVRKKTESGEAFESLAAQYSQDPLSAGKGGVIGSFVLETLSPVIKNAIKGVPVGGVTEVVPMDVGYHIFKVVGKTAERDYTFDEIKDRLRQLVIQEKSQNEYEQWVAELRKKTYVDVRLP
ncbi:MAG: peptidylprolyl isomerase [Candidatus Eisenbacteria bacterium]|nr:peptidylprolyl isomerase [Candidatus Eisenbacteria bacterium]